MPEPRFAPGDTVRVSERPPETHSRTPYYLRGQAGTVTEVAGIYRNPSQLAFHKPGLPAMPLYRVRFRRADLWDDAAAGHDTVMADLYEHWLLADEDR